MGVCALSPSDVEALRDYMKAITDFVYAAQGRAEALEPQSVPFGQLRIGLLTTISERRQGAFVAGVLAGEAPERMKALLDACYDACARFRPRAEGGSGSPWPEMMAVLATRLGELGDLIALAEARLGKGTSAVAKTGLTRTEEAVLSIIKAQPKGKGVNGKGIIKQFKGQGVTLKESSLRKHLLPKLIKHHGVVNHRAAGGYLIP